MNFREYVTDYKRLVTEGGAAGHMSHPFDLASVKSGKDLIKAFEHAAQSLTKNPGAVKIDGVNAAIRLVGDGNDKQFAMDRGSMKPLDVEGITADKLVDRFGSTHGLVRIGHDVLSIFNSSINDIKPELKKLGMWDNPNIMFNMEYVSGRTNVQEYQNDFLAIHGLLEIKTQEVQGKLRISTKRLTYEKQYSQPVMDRLIDKVQLYAKKEGFEVYGSVPTEMTSTPDIQGALNAKYTINFSRDDVTNTLHQWLNEVDVIPKADRITMIVNGAEKDVGALSKQVYFAVVGGADVDELFKTEEDRDKGVKGAITYLATEKIGDAVLEALGSPMGPASDHEGVVVRDPVVSPKPFKITGKFITGGVLTPFAR